MRKVLIAMSMAATLLSCSSDKTHYASPDDYPVRKGSLCEMKYSPKQTEFAVWSPAAQSVYLNIYTDAITSEATDRLPMERQKDGTWKLTVKRDLAGRFYTFQVTDTSTTIPLHETPGIFAKAVGINGKRAAVIDMRTTDPEGWEQDVRPALAGHQDAIIYEMHHRDLSIDSTSGVAHPGKFLALTEHGTTSPEGLATGIDHLLELGITHVQILPSYDFGSIDEQNAGGEATVLESGAAAGGSYNWGYDPINYNVPEGSYATDPYDPACRVRELKQMIQALHKAGIRVVMDVVYNHTYDVDNSNFTQTAPGYFYRLNEDGSYGNASGCGNETASERPMMRKFILESVRYWVEEYHMDGFRFDLMGIHDVTTMNEVRKMLDEIDPTILLYGEGWAAGDPLIPASDRAVKANLKNIARVGAFCDDMRDGLRGPFSDDHQGAFLVGLPGNEESVRFGIVGCIDFPGLDMSKVNYSNEAWTLEPTQCISYVSCHDDMMLTDRLKASIASSCGGQEMQPGEFVRLDKLAQTAVLTSQGIPFIWNGEELLRDKKGVHNSFCSPDSINAINWSLKAANHSLFDYYRGLIALRKAHPAFHMGSAEEVRKHLTFLDVTNAEGEPEPCVVAYRLSNHAGGDEWEDIIVVLNAQRPLVGEDKAPVCLALPEGTYTYVVRDGKVLEDAVNQVSGTLAIPAQTAVIIRK